MQYWAEFVTIAVVHLLAVASPGPDFAVVVKHSISYGRRAALLTSIGIGLGIALHVAYSLLGIGLLIKTTPLLYQAFTFVAAGYLLYLGWGALQSKPTRLDEVNEPASQQVALSDKKAFWIGLLTNGLNPKATLFFLSVFAVAVSVETPLSVKVAYGVYLCFATALWFCLLSLFLSTKRVRAFIGDNGYLFDRVMGGILVALAIKLVFFN
ncbi:LysE family translocator [Aestuariibacter salexigens]|uniref:LysE family translocator n=1 Tax=Aestuariibacter salexigens TaxID=226010 RepID=UPI0004150534|nr:LysE family translocator [Aestuariibacter salexigens]